MSSTKAELLERLKTGTTTVGVKVKDAIVLAADTKATMGNIAADLNAVKVFKITDRMAITIAGGSGDAMMVVRFLKSHAKLFELETEQSMTTKALMTFLANILNGNRYYPFMAFFILGGYTGKPELYSTDLVGGWSEVQDFTSIGSGSDIALGVLEHEFKAGMKKEDAVRLAVRAIKVSKKRDVMTGGERTLVMVIDENGVRELEDKEVEKYV